MTLPPRSASVVANLVLTLVVGAALVGCGSSESQADARLDGRDATGADARDASPEQGSIIIDDRDASNGDVATSGGDAGDALDGTGMDNAPADASAADAKDASATDASGTLDAKADVTSDASSDVSSDTSSDLPPLPSDAPREAANDVAGDVRADVSVDLPSDVPVETGPAPTPWPAPGTGNGDHTPLDGMCRFARAAKYPVARGTGNVPQGTCNFGAAGVAAPQLFRDGYIVAPNEAFFRAPSGQKTSCGECLEITGPRGRMTAMVADICDTLCCEECRGDTVQLDIEEQHWEEIAESVGIASVSYRWVPCPVTGMLQAHFTTYGAGNYTFRVTMFNQRVPIAKVEILGTAAGSTQGAWTVIPQNTGVTGTFDWFTGGNAGFPFQLRATSFQGEVVTFPPVAALSNNLIVAANGQFTNQTSVPDRTCAWSGPSRIVYDDKLQGLGNVSWKHGGSYGLTPATPNFAQATGCQSGSCIDVGVMGAYSGMQLTFPNRFPAAMFTAIEFWARATGGSYAGVNVSYSGTDAAGQSKSALLAPLALTATWQKFTIDLAPLANGVTQINTLKWLNQVATASPGILLDEIRLISR